jgi:hypothetical protein
MGISSAFAHFVGRFRQHSVNMTLKSYEGNARAAQNADFEQARSEGRLASGESFVSPHLLFGSIASWEKPYD